ncbi:MAG: PdaC/SigV domain-containing protein [Hyphomonas sp.]
MTRHFLTASIAALALAACTPPEGAPAAGQDGTDAAVETSSASLPASLGNPAFEEITEDYEIRAVVDSRIVEFDPQLADNLFRAAQAELDGLKAQAIHDSQAAKDEAAASGGEVWFHQYAMEYRFETTALEGDVISILQNVYVYTGGAHPNYALTGFVHQRGTAYPLTIDAIVADPAAFGAALKSRLTDEKMERAYGEASRSEIAADVDELLGDDTRAGTVSGANFTLEPSTEPGLFGGIAVLFSPYDVGPYAEGSYVITIPASELEGRLTPDWATRFGGEPVPRGDGE